MGPKMPRKGELVYYERLSHAEQGHAVAKPFSDADCGSYLERVGALFSLLPAPPDRILECGCGTGWLAYFLSRRSYEVVATDVAEDAIRLAQCNPMFRAGPIPNFLVADTETLDFESTFDAVVFFDSLHHAVDELAALRSAFRALRPGGVCIALEPGRGHHRKSAATEADLDVTEKDMPPSYIRRLGFQAGFTRCRIFPAPQHMAKTLHATDRVGTTWLRRWLRLEPIRWLAVLGIVALRRWTCGITVLHKDGAITPP
jgi:SAM-dependent methyltransferase